MMADDHEKDESEQATSLRQHAVLAMLAASTNVR